MNAARIAIAEAQTIVFFGTLATPEVRERVGARVRSERGRRQTSTAAVRSLIIRLRGNETLIADFLSKTNWNAGAGTSQVSPPSLPSVAPRKNGLGTRPPPGGKGGIMFQLYEWNFSSTVHVVVPALLVGSILAAGLLSVF